MLSVRLGQIGGYEPYCDKVVMLIIIDRFTLSVRLIQIDSYEPYFRLIL